MYQAQQTFHRLNILFNNFICHLVILIGIFAVSVRSFLLSIDVLTLWGVWLFCRYFFLVVSLFLFSFLETPSICPSNTLATPLFEYSSVNVFFCSVYRLWFWNFYASRFSPVPGFMSLQHLYTFGASENSVHFDVCCYFFINSCFF